jgi:hypothetical protein
MLGFGEGEDAEDHYGSGPHVNLHGCRCLVVILEETVVVLEEVAFVLEEYMIRGVKTLYFWLLRELTRFRGWNVRSFGIRDHWKLNQPYGLSSNMDRYIYMQPSTMYPSFGIRDQGHAYLVD